MAKRLSDEEWAAARAMWETDPKVTYADVGARFGVSKQAVRARASRADDLWERKTTPQELSRKAQIAADRVSAPPTPELPVNDSPPLPSAPSNASETAEDEAVRRRADVLARHRTEWGAARTLAYQAVKANDFDKAKHAKIFSETLKLIQDGERKAYGMDAEGGAQKIVITREDD